MIDRGFIKWQPFNSIINQKELWKQINKETQVEKPQLFPEEIANLNTLVIEAYYSQNKIQLSFYEQNKMKKIQTQIIKINPEQNTVTLSNHHTLSFNQIIHIDEIHNNTTNYDIKELP